MRSMKSPNFVSQNVRELFIVYLYTCTCTCVLVSLDQLWHQKVAFSKLSLIMLFDNAVRTFSIIYSFKLQSLTHTPGRAWAVSLVIADSHFNFHKALVALRKSLKAQWLRRTSQGHKTCTIHDLEA